MNFIMELKELMEKHGVESIRPTDADAFISNTENRFMYKMEVKWKQNRVIGDSITDDTEAMRELTK